MNTNNSVELLKQELIGEYRIALLDDGDKFIRMRSPDPYAGNIERMDLLEVSKLRDFLNSAEVVEALK